MTVNDAITQALQRLGVYGPSETIPAEDATFGLSVLNLWIDGVLQTERLAIYQMSGGQSFPIVSGTGAYTIGPGGAVNIARPVFIDHVNFQDTSVSPALERQMTPLTDDAWSRIPQKTLQSQYPTGWYWNPTFSSGQGTLSLFPVPTSGTLLGVLYQGVAVAQFPTGQAGLNTTLSLPPGYGRFIVTNLALELAPAYERRTAEMPELIMQASEAKANVKRANIRLLDLSVEAGALIQGQGRRFFYDINVGP